MARLVVGCGYLGMRVATLWRQSGDQVFALTRSEERAEEFARQGLEPIVADITDVDSLGRMPDVDTVLFAVGFDRTTGHAIQDVYVAGLRNFLQATGAVGRFVYISTTGVYGQNKGEWVDESSEATPLRDGGRASLEAEGLLGQSDLTDRTIILRLAGIYGPGRVPNQKMLLAGEQIAVPAASYLNLIHVEDAARIVQAAAERLTPPDLLLVSDGNPVLRRDYYRTAANLLGAPEPTFGPADPALPATARATSDKQISNARLLETLQYDFLYPSHHEGLAAIVE